MPELNRSRIQKAKVDGQMLDLTIDMNTLPKWKQDAIVEMVEVINDPDADKDDKDSANDTLSEIFMLFEKG